MQRSIESRLKSATVLLTFVGFFALTTTYHYGASLLLIPIATLLFMPIGERLDRSVPVYRQATSFLTVLYIFSFVLIVQQFSLLDAVVSLVIYVQVYSLVHEKHPANYAHILLMSFFLLLAASVMQPGAEIAFVFFFFVAGMIWALTLLEMFSSARRAQPGFESRFLIRRGDRDERQARPAIFDFGFVSLLALTTVGVLAMTSLIFAVGPRTEIGLLGASDATAEFTTGVSPEVSLTNPGILLSDTSPVMRAQFPKEPGGRFNGLMLWRVTAMDSYTGTGWVRRGLVTQGSPMNERIRRFKSDYRVASREGLERRSLGNARLVYQELFIDQFPELGVPLLQMVKTVIPNKKNNAVQFRWDIAGDFTALMSTTTERGISLQVWSEVLEPSVEELRQADIDYGPVMKPSDYEHLTYENLQPATLELVRTITEDEPTAYDKVVALEQYLGGAEFEYTRIIPELPAEHAIDEFILNVRAGHCELYASSLALMSRSLGLPTRLVSGYRGGMWDDSDASYTVTNDMAHVWTEVYFPEVGWISFDPSPTEADPVGFSMKSLARTLSLYSLKARILWLKKVIGFRPGEDGLMLRDVAARLFHAGGSVGKFLESEKSGTTDTPKDVRGVSVFVAGLVAVAGAGFMLLRLRRDRLRPSRFSLTGDQVRAVRLHRIIARKLRTLGVETEGKTAEEIATELGRLGLSNPDMAGRVLEAYNEARFGARAFTSSAFDGWRREVAGMKLAAEN